MTRGIWAAIQLGMLDMRGDIRRFSLLVVCLAVGTALIAGVLYRDFARPRDDATVLVVREETGS